MNKFVILGHARSGSTLLADILEGHRDIICKGEIFDIRYLRNIPNSFEANYNIHERFYDTERFLNSFYRNYLAVRDTVGYKFVLNTWITDKNDPFVNHYGLGKAVINDKSVKKIVIYRKNLLQAAVSLQVAIKTNQWTLTKEGSKKMVDGLHVDEFWCQKYLIEVTSKLDNWDKFLQNNGHSYIKVSYEELIEKEILKDIYSFLEVDHIPDIDTQFKKINTNYDHIKNKSVLNKLFGKQFGLL